MGCLLALVLVALLLAGTTWLTIGLAGLLITLFIAGLVGGLADLVIPGQMPGGIFGAVLAGMIGGFIGNLLLGLAGMADVGPRIAGVEIIPAFVGALVVVAAAEALTNSRARRSMR